MPRYYELEDNLHHPGRWHLRSPMGEQGQRINPWQFFKGSRLESWKRSDFP
ncbi:MAG TPA: hypothetical protein VEY88_00920 [Archangium sp.]|nr:hypothetical protein [Archangium sp.]